MDSSPAKAPVASEWKSLGPAALRAFFRIATKWELTTAEQLLLLGQPARGTLYNWKNGKGTDSLSYDQITRLSYITGIYKTLHLLHKESAPADKWLHMPNQNLRFGGEPPLALLLRGNIVELAEMRRFLDGARG